MNRAAPFLAAALFACAMPALADEACPRPTAPEVAVDGASATVDQLTAAKDEVARFIAASDEFQACLIKDLDDRRAAAKAAKTKLDPAVEKATKAALEANQQDKLRAGGAFNAAVKAYKAAHPT